MKTYYVSISDFGSIAGENKWKPREFTVLKAWVQNNPTHAFEYFKRLGYIVEETRDTSAEVNNRERRYKDKIKRIKTSGEAEEIIGNYTAELKNQRVKEQSTKKQITEHVDRYVETADTACIEKIKELSNELTSVSATENIREIAAKAAVVAVADKNEARRVIAAIPAITEKSTVMDNVSDLTQNMKSRTNTERGTNNETQILNDEEQRSKCKIRERNSKMHYKTIYQDENFKYKIGGKVDGISSDGMIIEAKYRTRSYTVRKNRYDLFQIMGYMFVLDCPKGKIIQKYEDETWDSDKETRKEWGIITLDERWDYFYKEKLLPFFEELKEFPEIPANIKKPFLYVNNGVPSPNILNGELENFIVNQIRM